ncbi:MAG TPA: nuclear transport factor 2 family protein [Bryobacteraceae bacterium]|nr:nuclear transport factor 2 family protein [Bryobacteraceae bacterium]
MSRTEAMMRKVTARRFYAALLAAMTGLAVMSSVGIAQTSSRNANESEVSTVQATKDPKDMSSAELTATVKLLDAELFSAYNNCELEKFGSFFPEHLEFYHDQTGGGPMTREQLVAAIKQNICGKVHRELVSLEVFPMKNYGALETGVHRFSHPGIDTDQGDAKFVQLWKYENGRWWMTVVISYDHNEPVLGKTESPKN